MAITREKLEKYYYVKCRITISVFKYEIRFLLVVYVLIIISNINVIILLY